MKIDLNERVPVETLKTGDRFRVPLTTDEYMMSSIVCEGHCG